MPRILLTNDDGLGAPGIEALLAELAGFADVWVVAPESERSGVGHGLTLHTPLYVRDVEIPGARGAIAVSGTPADCVKFAVTSRFADVEFDLVASGVNNGPNAGTNVIYSGTVAGAREGVICGIPAIACSVDFGPEPRCVYAAQVAGRIVRRILETPLPEGVWLNVNVPNLPAERIRGMRITRNGTSGFRERYIDEGADESGRRRYRLEGDFILNDPDESYDAAALKAGWISITPLALEATARGEWGEPQAWSHLLDS